MTMLPERELRRNVTLGVISGMLFRLFYTLAEPSLVLTWFMGKLTTSRVLIGLPLPIASCGYFLPQLFLSRYVECLPRKIVAYRMAAAVRMVVWVAMTAIVFAFGDRNPTLVLSAFLALFSLNALTEGGHGLAFLDVVGSVVPSQQRGRFFAWRDFGGAVLGLGGSAVVAFLLDQQRGLSFAQSYGLLFALAGVILLLSLGLFSLIREPPTPPLPCSYEPRSITHVRELAQRDPNYALFVLVRVLHLLSTVAMPFYSVYAKEQLHAPAAVAGRYSALYTAAFIGSTLLWGRLSDRKGNRLVFLLATLLVIPCPLIPLLWGAHLSYARYGLVFLLLGMAEVGVTIGAIGFTLDAAPASQRVLYVSLVNTILGVTSLPLMAGGLVAERLGLRAVFMASALLVSVAAGLGMVLKEPRRVRAEASAAQPA